MHPDVRHFWTALVTDLCSSYDIDGILFFNERNGPLLNATGSSHFQQIASASTTCFCEHHRKAAREHGIDFERAREGYRKLDAFVKAALADRRPSDGYFVEFWRLLVEYPEIIAWDRLFDLGKHQVLAEVRAAVKAIKPELEVGFHIEHVNSFNPIFRATRRYADLAGLADFLKVVVYNNCGGERYRRFIENVGSTVFRDVPKDELLRFNNHLLGYGDEASLGGAARRRTLARLRRPRDEAGPGRRGREVPDPARHRHRDPDGTRQPQGEPGGHLCRRGRRAEGGGGRGDPLAQVFRDATGQPLGRRTRGPRERPLTRLQDLTPCWVRHETRYRRRP